MEEHDPTTITCGGWQTRVFRSESGELLAKTRRVNERESDDDVTDAADFDFMEEGTIAHPEEAAQYILFPAVGDRRNIDFTGGGKEGRPDVLVRLSGIVTRVEPEGGSTILLDTYTLEMNIGISGAAAPPLPAKGEVK